MNTLRALARMLSEFPFQLIVASNLFAWAFPKRPHFWLRAILLFVPMMIVYDLGTQRLGMGIVENAILDRSLMLLPGLYICLGIFLCYRCSLSDALFCTASAHPAQNMLFNACRIVFINARVQTGTARSLVISLVFMTVLYACVYYLFVRRLKDSKGYRIIQHRLNINSAIILLFVVYLYGLVPDEEPIVLAAFIIGDLLALVMQFELFNESAIEQKNAILEQLLYAERKKHQQINETTEIINRKCHDLKHQLAGLRRMNEGPERDEYCKQIEDAIMIYESAVDTGNQTLDLILMDKLLYCNAHDIKLTFMADGTAIAWMDTMDLYALIGNALDNAIESVSQEPEACDRIISFRINGSGSMVSLHFENYIGHEVTIRDGLPITSKEDTQYHGFGMLSIRHVVEKYGGTMSIRADDHMFRLNILFPI